MTSNYMILNWFIMFESYDCISYTNKSASHNKFWVLIKILWIQMIFHRHLNVSWYLKWLQAGIKEGGNETRIVQFQEVYNQAPSTFIPLSLGFVIVSSGACDKYVVILIILYMDIHILGCYSVIALAAFMWNVLWMVFLTPSRQLIKTSASHILI